MTVETEIHGRTLCVRINRPEVRNAVDGRTAAALVEAFEQFERDDAFDVAVLCGSGGSFCAGADLKAVADGSGANRMDPEGPGPMGPSRMRLSKPVLAAVDGHAVAGGLELALWCDLRIADASAVFGVFCRRWGVPLVDGGTVRLPRMIGHSRAMDMILTGRAVAADEAYAMGLINRLTPPGEALNEALLLAEQLSAFPQHCLRADRASAINQWSLDEEAALSREFAGGDAVVAGGETGLGATRFRDGRGRHGDFSDF